MENSKIEWTNHTFNPWWGCEKVSEGCKNCYAEALDKRFMGNHWGPKSKRKPMSENHWLKPIQWNRDAEDAGINSMVFCASMADVFEDHPDIPEWRYRLFSLIEKTRHLTWQLLTKRPENILKMVPVSWRFGFPSNVWVGTSAENQEQFDKRIDHLARVPASILFLSCEPLLGPLTLTDLTDIHRSICVDWVIVGGESGPKARPINPEWVRSIKDQCHESGTPFFFKQWGGTNKLGNGALLDGSEWRDFPKQHGYAH